jgi:hypothetical protein
LVARLGYTVDVYPAIKLVETFRKKSSSESPHASGPSLQSDIEQLRMKVAKDLSCRPDFIVNKYLRTGWLFGKHYPDWPHLDETKLSAEEKAKLPSSYYEKGALIQTCLHEILLTHQATQ